MTAASLHNILAQFFATRPKAIIKVNVSRGDTFESIVSEQSIFRSSDPVSSYRKLIRLLTRFLYRRFEYENPVAPHIQFVELPMANPALEGFRDGVYNCACLPVLEYLHSLPDNRNNRTAIQRVQKIGELYLENGIGELGLAQLAKTSGVRLLVIDATGAVWKEYESAGKTHASMILYAHNRHFKRVLAAEQHLINFIKIGKQEVVWLPKNFNFDKLNAEHIEAQSICSKGGQAALITTDVIYKVEFTDCDVYPESFTDGGVGKAKFLEQCPMMKGGLNSNDPFYQIYFDADVSGFYCENSASNPRNVKYDHNHSYKSFDTSPAGFKGFPIIDAIFGIDAHVSASTNLFQYDGLLYLDVPQLTSMALKATYPPGTKDPIGECPDELVRYWSETYEIDVSVADAMYLSRAQRGGPQFEDKGLVNPIYYEGANWYPVEIVKYWYDTYGVDPKIKAFAYASTTFNMDFSSMTNAQFRCFVGKTTSKDATSTWRTTDHFEYLRGLYQLQDSITGVHQYSTRITDDVPLEQKVFEITYKNDKAPWQLPVISAYVKAHQKVILFERYNALLAIGVVPVCVRVDGIEIACSDAEKVASSDIFDVGAQPGQWKLESIKAATYTEGQVPMVKYLARDVPAVHPLMAEGKLVKFTPDAILPRLVHFSGAGGNGKTHKLLELKRTYPSLCIAAPTHEACDVIAKRAVVEGIDANSIKIDTYHRIFGIGCPANIPANCTMFAIDECSMVPEEHLVVIDTTLRAHFKSELPFGGAQIILLGDFWQLPPISPMVSLHNNWSGVKSELYALFTEIELTKNWRQQTDPTFYALCQKLRTQMSQEDAVRIIDYLNQRVAPPQTLPSYSSLDDMYIAGVNDQTSAINKPFEELPVGSKVICQTGCNNLGGSRIPKGKVLTVIKNEHGDFQVSDNPILGVTHRFKSAGLLKPGKGKSRFAPAMALTVHKSQGKTLRGNVVIDPTRLFERNHLYTALTRATCFVNIHLTAPIVFHQFARTAFVVGVSKEPTNLNSKRLESMVATYKHEEPRLTYKFLSDMRVTQNNFCCYCKAPMVDTFGYDDSITLERIDDAKRHVLENVKLACFKCNSLHVKDPNNI
jgi:hypothetical protein